MFDETGERTDASGAAVYALTAGGYWCMLAESDGEAALFDAPEGGFVSSALEFPTGTWLSESIEAILAPGTKLTYIVYTHSHWDHMGAAGLVYDHFAQDRPTIIASKRSRAELKARDDRDPTSVHGNNRGVPIPEKLEAADYRELHVGNLRFEAQKIHAHERGDLFVFLDKTIPENAAEGIDNSIFMIVDTIFPGWIPFASVAISNDIGGYYEAQDEILTYDFDVLVAGHLTRMGTKADVQLNKDFYDDVLEGARSGLAAVSSDDIAAGTGIFDPNNPNAGNTWLFFAELLERQADVCVAYVLDVASRGRDWLTEMAGVEVTLRSQCWAVSTYIRNINNIITMNKNNNDTTNKNNNSSSMTEITTTKKCQGETRQPGLQLYKSAARNLREYHGVPSITAESVEKTMALLQLRPARLVAQGLTSRKLLKAEAAMPDSSLDSNSSSDSSTNSDVEMDENAITSDTSDSGGTISISTDNSGSDDDDNEINHDLEAEDCKRPVHTALAAAGIKLRPRETRPLLLALGVRPQRLVKLGLVDREALLRSRRITLGRAIGRVRGEGPSAAVPTAVKGTLITSTASTTKAATTAKTCTATGTKEKNTRACAEDLVTTAVPVMTEKDRATADATTSAV
eukprot:g2039.t1